MEKYQNKQNVDLEEQIKKYINANNLTREMVEAFVETIVVCNDGSFSVNMKIKNEYDEIMKKWHLYNDSPNTGGFEDAG